MLLSKNCPPNLDREAGKGTKTETVIAHGVILKWSAGLITEEVLTCVIDEIMLAYVKEKPSFYGLRNITEFRNFLESTLYGQEENVRPSKVEVKSE